jgi:transposase
VLDTTRSAIVEAGANARRQLTALSITAPSRCGTPCAGVAGYSRLAPALGWWLRLVIRWSTTPPCGVAHDGRAGADRPCEDKELEVQLRMLITAVAPVLLTQRGVGPIGAAQVLISWSHPGRFRSEAAFAMLAGAAPVEASSGRVVRHRLNRGGDRQLNRALHTIVMIRQTHHQPTQVSTTRRIARGKSQRDIRRCLARAVARGLYRLLERKVAPSAA